VNEYKLYNATTTTKTKGKRFKWKKMQEKKAGTPENHTAQQNYNFTN
jgi:hypothetical protein